jgi:LPS sulfotransferase NodH
MNRLKKAYGKLLHKKRKLNNSLFGNKEYKKFIIISRSRTGSTFLMALLNKHSNMICEGELFKKLDGNSCQTIWNNLFSKKPKRVKYVGCKLFYYHPFDDDKQVWDFIDQDKSIVIIHLTRKQYLEAYVSQKIGEKTKQWSESKFKPHNLSLEDKQVKLDLEE